LKVYASSLPGNISLFIVDINGRMVKSYNRQLFQAGETFYLPLQGLAKGLYWITGVSGKEKLDGGCFVK